MRKCKSENAGVDTRELTIYIEKYLKAKEEELWKIQIFHHAEI